MVAVLLMMIMFGIIEGSRIFSSWLIITNEAREAARYGAVAVGDPSRQPTLVSQIQNRVSAKTAGILDQSQLTATAVLGPNLSTPQWFEVRIDYRVEIVTAPLLFWFPRFVPITAVSTMRTEDGAVGGG